METKTKPETLPDDPTELKKILHSTIDSYESQLTDKNREYIILEEKYKLLLHKMYGRKSEKTVAAENEEQLFLFNEAELGITALEEEIEDFEEEEKAVLEEEQKALSEHIAAKEAKKEKVKKRGGKIQFPSHLPRRRVIHDLAENEKAGRPLIREEITEELNIKVDIEVIQHVYPVYGQKKEPSLDEKAVVSAKRSERLLKGCQVSDDFIAHIIVSKYSEGLPFYRQEKQYRSRNQLKIPRSRMCYWVINLGRKLEELTDLMKEDIRGGPLIQMDETTVQVLKEPGRDARTKSYMWAAAGTTRQYKRIILFHYYQHRSKDIPPLILGDYVGYLQTDGYDSYIAVGESPGIIHLGCWAHVRRYFIEAEKISKKSKSEKVALSYIRQIYLAEEKYRGQLENNEITEDDFVVLRKKAVKPLLEKFKKWLDGKKLVVTPKSKLGEAVNHALRQWPKLTVYLDTPFATPDNNYCENAIRPFVIGRKNWLFSDIAEGAYSSATFYSLIETAKANGLDPYHYLSYVFKNYIQAMKEDNLKSLLPYNLTPEMFNS